MQVPGQLKYSDEHVWVKLNGNEATVGITEFAQNELGDIVFVELPAAGDQVTLGEPFGSIESVKTVSELYAPLSGKILRVNSDLERSPAAINQSPYDEGWLAVLEVSDSSEVERLWSAEQYVNTYTA